MINTAESVLFLRRRMRSSAAGGNSRTRAVASNSNLIAYTTSTTTNRFINYSKDRILAPNANWTKLRLTHNNWVKSNTSEVTGLAKVIRAGIIINNVFYQATWGGATEKVMGAGLSIESDDIIIPSTAGGTNITIRTRVANRLNFDGQTGNFTVGQVVTGGTSGATGIIQAESTDAGTTGGLVLLNETGTFVDNEALTDPLGGAAVANINASGITTFSTVGALPIWNEGSLTTSNSATDWTMSNNFTSRLAPGAVTINGSGNITAVAVTTAGVGYTTPSTVYAWQIGSNGILYYKSIGNTNTAHSTITVSSGTPPTGLAAWDSSVTIAIAGGNDFGAATAVYDACLLTGIPDRPVKSILLDGDSITRGYSSTDTVGDTNHSYGFYERIIAKECGVINLSTPGASFANEILYASSFVRSYALYMGKATHCLIALGSNDITDGTSLVNLQSRSTTLSTYIRSFGTIVGYGNVIPRGDNLVLTGISRAANAVVTATNTFVGGETINFATDISGAGAILGMTQIRGLTGTVVSATLSTFTVNIDSSAFTAYTSGGYYYVAAPTTSQIPETGFSLGGVCDLWNADLGVGVPVDFPVVRPRTLFRDSVVTTAWKTTPSGYTFDTVHPSQLGHTAAAADTTLISELAFLGE